MSAKPTDEALREWARGAVNGGFLPVSITVPNNPTIHRTEKWALVEALIAVPLNEKGEIAE